MNKYQVMMLCLGAVLASMTVAVVVLRNHGYLEDSGGFILFGVYFIVLVMAFALRYAGNDYASNTNEKTVPDSVSATSEKLKAIWGKAKLTTKTDANIRKNVKNLFEEYQALKKDRNRITDGAELKRKIWKGDLEDLFDISSADVLERRDILDEDKSFLISQREDRSSSSMAGVDVTEVAKEKKKKEAAKKLENRKRKQEAETECLLEKVPYR
ncbi:hypothetical protein GWK47_053369 [Chionoecetes opilio]|uniref:Uncharacterized protein n=1 Tax=Chionoecetes opilio TaxID=41210 RepID=A0A8J4Y823_CHIOP|nr:hypothetical protein GWK47_053369 [Chionoecetes opilio]